MLKRILILGAISIFALGTTQTTYAVEAEVSNAQTAEDGGITCRNAGVFSTRLINNVLPELPSPAEKVKIAFRTELPKPKAYVFVTTISE